MPSSWKSLLVASWALLLPVVVVDSFRISADPSLVNSVLSQLQQYVIKSSLMTMVPPPLMKKKKTIMVVGATGQTGRRVLQQMLSSQECHAIGGVRNTWAAERLSREFIVFRGFQRTTVPAVTAPGLEIRQTDVINTTDQDLRQALLGVDTLVIATGMVPSPRNLGNPFLLHRQARAVDCVGTQRLIDAAKQTGTVRKVVLLSSILTNARHWNQTSAPGFFITNLLGSVLDRKLEAERHLRASGLEYTIVRAAELTSPQPQAGSSTAEVVVCAEDTLNGGTISRDLVASVCVECALSDKNHKYSNQVIEIHQK